MIQTKVPRASGGKLTTGLVISRPVVLVLAEGKTDADRNNEKGHLFEKFVALLLEAYGYETPTPSKLNVTSNGIELDVVTAHQLTKHRAVAECKAYSKNLTARDLSAFFGKVQTERFDDPHLTGFFVAIPGLTAEGNQQFQKISSRDKSFHLLTAEEIPDLLRKQQVLPEIPIDGLLRSDPAIVVTRHGTYLAAKTLDTKTRLATSVQVFGLGVVPDPVIPLIAMADFAAGLPVVRSSSTPLPKPAATGPAEPTIVEVIGSKSELEYQLPASPRFFVGRRELVKGFEEMLSGGVEKGVVLVLNGQSGWGKSSLSLQLKNTLHHRTGYGAVYDSRTASSPEFVWQALRRALLAAEKAGVVDLPEDASFASLNSILSTIRAANWASPDRPLLVFFDQFENVFRDTRLTQEFRDLSLAIRDTGAPVIIGFAWKTDLVGLTETYPFQLRDDIRSYATVFIMEPLGPSEINTLLRRLEKSTGQKFQKDLKQRLREVSQGLPWLFKKLASHVDRELKGGTTQEDLVSESLNVKRLFETDLAELEAVEREALKKIAKLAPRPASDVVEIVSGNVVQSLLDRRLIVRVGELLDTYWDIFRDFLVTGEVVVAETYILRQTPFAVAKLLREVVSAGGDLTVEEASQRLQVTEGGLFNLSRELRQTGVISERPRHVHVSQDIMDAQDREAAIRERVSMSLKRHRGVSMLKEMVENQDGSVTLSSFSEALPRAFPAIQATKAVWRQYARVFVNWLEYAGLAKQDDGNITLPPPGPPQFQMLSPGSRSSRRVRGSGKFFPSSRPAQSIPVLQAIAKAKKLPEMKPSVQRKALTDLLVIGLITTLRPNVYTVKANVFNNQGQLQQDKLLAILDKIPGPHEALRLLKRRPKATSVDIGKALQEVYQASWNELTTVQTGTKFKAWARAAGLHVARTPGGKQRKR